VTIKLKNRGNAFFLSGKQGKADTNCKPVGRRQKRQASKQTRSQQAVEILHDEAHWQEGISK
jgi:hypothetical protein